MYAALWSVCVYRAWSQSITLDEAANYASFTAHGLRAIFTTYNAGNHVLFSFLQRLSTANLGESELALRLPSLIGALLYFAACYRICRRTFGDDWRLLPALLALGLNPLVLDHLSAARGYGLGLGLLLWAIAELLAYRDEEKPWRLFRAGVALGLAVAAVPVYLYPAAALWALIPVTLGRRRFWHGVEWFTGPGAMTAFLILVVPLSQLALEHYYFGTATFSVFVSRLVDLSFFHDPRIWSADLELRPLPWVYPLLSYAIVPGMLLLGLRRIERLGLLAGAALALTLAALAFNRLVLGVPLPNGRTGLYLLPLFTLTVIPLFSKGRPRWQAFPALAFTFGSVALYASGWTTSYYAEWHFNRGTREIVRFLEEKRGGRATRLCTSWLFAPSVEYYQRRGGLHWLTLALSNQAMGDCDYYYLPMTERQKAADARKLSEDPIAQTMLAEKR